MTVVILHHLSHLLRLSRGRSADAAAAAVPRPASRGPFVLAEAILFGAGAAWTGGSVLKVLRGAFAHAECDFKDFLPRHGHSVVTVVRSEVALSACDFRGCQVTNGAQGLVGSIGNGSAPPASSMLVVVNLICCVAETRHSLRWTCVTRLAG